MQHLDPDEAVQASLDLGAVTMLGMHWGTFDLTDEPVDLPPKRLAEVVRERVRQIEAAALLRLRGSAGEGAGQGLFGDAA